MALYSGGVANGWILHWVGVSTETGLLQTGLPRVVFTLLDYSETPVLNKLVSFLSIYFFFMYNFNNIFALLTILNGFSISFMFLHWQ